MPNLTDVRSQINDIDQQLLALITKRLELAQSVAQAKKEIDKPVLDKKREEEIIMSLQEQDTLLSADCIETLWKELFRESRKKQEEYLK